MEEATISLLAHLDPTQVNCLNESDTHDLKSIIKKSPSSTNYLLSDADEQLLLNIPFNQTVRIRSIVLQTKENIERAPLKIKLLINRPSLGFEDVENLDENQVAQELVLTEEQVKEGKKIPLRFVRFQTVNSLHIFVASNHGGEDETRIDALDIFGSLPVMAPARDLSAMRKQDDS